MTAVHPVEERKAGELDTSGLIQVAGPPSDNPTVPLAAAGYGEEAAKRRIARKNAKSKGEGAGMKDFFLYVLFIVSFSVLAYTSRGDYNVYWMSRIVKDDILTTRWDQSAGGSKSYYDIANSGDVYDFMKNSILPTYLAENYDNGTAYPPELMYYYTTQKVLSLRMRQVRVNANTCNTDPMYASYLSRACYGEYSDDIEQRTSFTGKKGAVYNWAESKEGATIGKLATYPSSGYSVSFKLNQSQAQSQLADLRDNMWIEDGPTRVVIIQIQTYSEPADLFEVGVIIIEIPAFGGYRGKTNFKAVRLPKFETAMEYTGLVVQVCLLVLVTFLFAQEVGEIRRHKFTYFRDLWNVVDFANIFLVWMVFILRMIFFQLGKDVNPLIDPGYSLTYVAGLRVTEDFFTAINAFLLWLKLFKYMQDNKRVSFLLRVLVVAYPELFFFCILFFLFLFSFAHAGYLAFSGHADQFRSLPISFATLFIDFENFNPIGVAEANRVWGSIYYITLQIIYQMILINMFIAIMNNSYGKVREELLKEPVDVIVPNVFKKLRFTNTNHIKGLLKKNTQKDINKSAEELAKEKEVKAAIKIQRVWRGKMARKKVDELRKAKPVSGQVEHQLRRILMISRNYAKKLDDEMVAMKAANKIKEF